MRITNPRELFVVLGHAVIISASFWYSSVNESQLPGDLEWAFYYAVLLCTSSCCGFFLSSPVSIILAISIACLTPFIAPAMLIIVSIIFSLIVSSIGTSAGIGVRLIVARIVAGKKEAEQAASLNGP